jgi:sodium/proline symporter
MTFAIVFVLIYSTISVGGISVVMDNVKELPGYLSFAHNYVEETNSAETYDLLHVISTLAWGLGYFGMPHILLRFMAIEEESKLRLSRRVASVWAAVAMAIAIMIGIVGRALTGQGLIEHLSGSNSETIIVKVADLLSTHGVFPALIAGLILAGILASTMSTADSQLLAASSSVSENILQEALHLQLSKETNMLVARLTVVAIAILGVFIARDPNSSIFGIVSFAWAGFGAAFGPLVLCSLFWKRTTFWGALAGMLAGGVFVFIWKYLIAPLGGVFGIYELLPAFLVGLVVIIVVSLLTKEPSQEIQDEFEHAKSGREIA